MKTFNDSTEARAAYREKRDPELDLVLAPDRCAHYVSELA